MTKRDDAQFDLHPGIYDQLVNWDRRLAREGTLFEALFAEHDVQRVLDLACGTGHHATLFARWGHAVVGVDGSAAMIAHCRETHGETARLQWACARMEELPTFETPFDAVVCLGNSLAILPDIVTVTHVLAAVSRRLRPGGLMITHTLNVSRLPDGPIVWQKARRISAEDHDRLFVKGVHRAGDRGFVDVAEAPLDAVDDVSRCRSTPILALAPGVLDEAFAAAGLEPVAHYGDHARAPFDALHSNDLIAVARRAAS